MIARPDPKFLTASCGEAQVQIRESQAGGYEGIRDRDSQRQDAPGQCIYE
jgi:hypothetical protein